MTTRMRGVALRLHGPLQAWGGPVAGDTRPTLSFPTRSGVLGLIAACFGIRRGDQTRLLALAEGTRVHVRVDVPGSPVVDDQTIQGHPGASPTRQTIQSKRTYLCNASFTAVVVPGPRVKLEDIAGAVSRPVFSPFLGRRACVPTSPLLLASLVEGLEPLSLFDSLPRGPIELLHALEDGRSELSELDFFLDDTPHPDAIRHFPVRDDLVGPLPRHWRERMTFHLRRPLTRSN